MIGVVRGWRRTLLASEIALQTTVLLTSLSAWQRAGGIDEALVAVQFGYIAGKGDDDVLRVRLEVPRPCKQRCVLDDGRRSQHCLVEVEAITGKLE